MNSTNQRKNYGIVKLYCGASGKSGYYNSQEVGLARSLKKRGYTVFIFYPELSGKELQEEIVDEGICAVFCPAKAIGVHSKFDWNILLSYHLDVVQVGSDNQIFAPDILRFCDKHGIAVYSLIGTVASDNSNRIKRILVELLFLRNASAYRKHMNFAKTTSVRDELLRLRVKQVELAPVGLDLSVIPQQTRSKEELRSEKGLSDASTIVLFVGRMEEYKQPLKMLKLMKSLPSGFTGIMIGDGALSAAIDDRIQKLNLESSVIRIKAVPNTEIHDYYELADYVVNFNENEIFGMNLLEAIYHGCTTVAIRAPGPDNIIKEGKTGYLVDDVEEMKGIILNRPRLNKDELRLHIMNNFTWDRTAQIFDHWVGKERNE